MKNQTKKITEITNKNKPVFFKWGLYTGNVTIVLLVLVSVIWVFVSQNEYGSNNPLKYYTVLSNILCGICAAVCIPFSYLLVTKENEKYEKIVYSFNLIGCTGTTLTMLVVFFFLTPNFGFAMMFSSYNLLMHLITPLVALITFVIFATGFYGHFLFPLYACPPSIIYALFYFGLYFAGVSEDFYGFLNTPLHPALSITFIVFGFIGICYTERILNALATRIITKKPLKLRYNFTKREK